MADVPLEISVGDAQRLIAAQDAKLRVIDVRDPDEYQLCRLPGAELIPLSALPLEAARKLPDKDAALLVYCHHGMRSLQAVNHLRARGYRRAMSMAGGTDRWSREIDPALPRY